MAAKAQFGASSSKPQPNVQDAFRPTPQRDGAPQTNTSEVKPVLPARYSDFARLPLYLSPESQSLPTGKIENAGPLTGYTVDLPSPPLNCISVPPKPDGASRSECLVTNEIKNQILSTPGFPAPLVHPPTAYRIGSAPGKGLGIFATRDLDMGDLICVERPLLVLPSHLSHVGIRHPYGWTRDQVIQAQMFEWEKQCYRAFERLEPDAQAAYLALANSHTEDGSGTTLGICRTNGFGIVGLVDIVGTYEARYSGICKEFSRANHSCRPNATRYFDMKSFAYYFSAARPIRRGEEITVGYALPEEPRSLRQQDLQKYGFECDCPACGPDSEDSDQNRADIAASVKDLIPNYVAWVVDKALPDDEIIKTSRWWIRVMESEGLESSKFYEQHLVAIYNAYIALGDKENTIKYGALIGKRRRVYGEPVEMLCDLRVFQKRPDWAMRRLNCSVEDVRTRLARLHGVS